MHDGGFRSKGKAGLVGLILAAATVAVADDSDMAELATLFPAGRHLLEVSYTHVDTEFGDRDIWLPRYTRAISTNLRASASVGYVIADPVGVNSREGGVTDSVVLLQYDPTARLTANAFVPDTLGIAVGLQLPTGDAARGLGEDLWAMSLGGGWLLDFPLDFWLLPSIQHEWTFSEGSPDDERERTDLGLGLYWLFAPVKSWLGFEPTVAYDHVVEDSTFGWSLVLGKVWANGWGLDARWTKSDRLQPRGARDDTILVLSVSYQFGQPPRGNQ